MQRTVSDRNIKLGLAIDGTRREMATLVVPRWVWWEGRTYRVVEVGMVYPQRDGINKIHMFAVSVCPKEAPPGSPGTLDMLIRVDAQSFAPRLEFISDGLPD